MRCLVLLARLFFSAIFILSSFGHFTKSYIAFAAKKGVLFPSFFVPFSGVLALIGGLSILLGYRAKIGAWLLIAFLVPVTIAMHKFWGLADSQIGELQRIMFMKNLSMLGGAILIAYFGSGPYSLRK